MAERTCRVCGCGETNACVREAGMLEEATLSFQGVGFVTCGWAEQDLCTACAGDPGEWRQPMSAADRG